MELAPSCKYFIGIVFFLTSILPTSLGDPSDGNGATRETTHTSVRNGNYRNIAEEIEPPIVRDVTDTTARILQAVKPDFLEYITNFRLVITSGVGRESAITRTSFVRSTYTVDITELHSGTMYSVRTFVSTNITGKVTEVPSPEISFATSSQRCFEVEPKSNAIVMSLRRDLKGCEMTGSALSGVSYYVKMWKEGIEMNDHAFVIPNFPYTYNELEPYTEYKLTVYTADGKIILWTRTVRTLQSAPGRVRNLRKSHVSDTHVTLQWDAPSRINGIIAKYRVSIKRTTLRACEDLGKQTPVQDDIVAEVNDTMASFGGLNPYAKYTASVIAYTTEPGMEKSIEFQTPERNIPTSSVRNLELINNQRRLKWDKPEDCLKITGSTKFTRLVFRSLNNSVENSKLVRKTAYNYLDVYDLNLAHYTSYNVRAYVLRYDTGGVNYTLYQEKNWTTAPSAPSAVKSIDVYEADLDTNTISLRWEPPNPANGEIEFYHVSITGNEISQKNWTLNTLGKTRFCELWKNYVCFENVTLSLNVASNFMITIYAKNKDVEQVGDSKSQTFERDFFDNQAPTVPKILPEKHLGHGVVMFKWEHPFSHIKITEFYITGKFLETDLWKKNDEEIPLTVNYTLTQRRKEYSQQLFLATSTSDEELQVVKNGTLIDLEVPVIINATRNTMINVIVKGSSNCTSRTSLAVINETELVVAEYNTSESKPRRLTIDTNRINTGNLNCSLLTGETYVIEVVVKSMNDSILAIIARNSISLGGNDLILLWLIAIIPILGVLIALLFWRRICKRASRARKNAKLLPKRTNNTRNLFTLFTSKRSKPSSYALEKRVSSRIYAVPFETDSRLVRAEYFPEYTKNASNSGLLLSQYMMFPRDLTKPCEYGKLPQNMPKNRDKKQIPYDDSRVVLQKISGDPDSDYINASYIQGHRGEKAYIATQGPLPNTVNDFWRMVWQEKVYIICMLTNVVEDGKTKCEQYWPEVGIKVKYGDVSVLVTDLKVFGDYTVRKYRLGCQKYKRKITHLHYTAWPDHGIPTYSQSLVTYLKKLMKTPTGNGPIVVHCSTGEGRTGTLILCDICLRQAAEEKVIDVLAVTTQMRESRANMVGSPEQYILAHIVIMESITGLMTRVECNDDFPTGIKRLREQLPFDVQRLNDTVWQERVLYSLVESKYPTPGDFARNKITGLDSVCPDVIYFERYSMPNSEKDTYIGAVSVDGSQTKKQYLASELPSKSTWSKFWLVIAKQNVQLIIILQRADPNDPTCCDIIPNKPIFAPVSHILVETKQPLQEEEHFTFEQFLLTDTSGDERRPQLVTVLRCTGWEQGRYGKPPSPATLVSLWRASSKIVRKEELSLVLCHDGVTGCGLYLALSFLLERMAVEKECDVISAVRAVRRFRPGFVRNLEDFEYLYDAAVNYVECFETYANFT